MIKSPVQDTQVGVYRLCWDVTSPHNRRSLDNTDRLATGLSLWPSQWPDSSSVGLHSLGSISSPAGYMKHVVRERCQGVGESRKYQRGWGWGERETKDFEWNGHYEYSTTDVAGLSRVSLNPFRVWVQDGRLILARARVHVCVCACVRACVRVCELVAVLCARVQNLVTDFAQ